MLEPITAAANRHVLIAALVALLIAIMLNIVLKRLCETRRPGLARTIYRLVVCRGRRLPGVLTKVVFPIHAAELTPERLTALLRHGGHLDGRTSVVAVRDRLQLIRDGVKGDKAIIDVEYGSVGGYAVSPPAGLPSTFFVKFSLQKLTPMRLLCECSEVSACEALFYTHLAADCRQLTPTPRCFFVDFNEVSGEFCLVSELMPFGEGTGAGAILPLKHRVRDAPSLAEQRRFAVAGASLNAAFWGESALRRGCLRFDATHTRAWTIMQALSWLGLHHSTRRTLKGRPIPNRKGYATWSAPPELLGKEGALIRDMPHIMTSLCEETSMTAFGHNDIVTDNAFFVRAGMPTFRLDATGTAADGFSISGRISSQLAEMDVRSFGLFDWQQSSVNSIGQEWAWNFHWLPPEFLTKHEDELVELLLATYRERGHAVSKRDFLRHYVLGCAQMFVFGGGGLQPLMGKLHAKGLLRDFAPDDERCRDGSLDGAELELAVGAEMTRRTFTNVCNIMRRHGFVEEWRRWRKERGMCEP